MPLGSPSLVALLAASLGYADEEVRRLEPELLRVGYDDLQLGLARLREELEAQATVSR